jgi:O-antigen/teichoic acid export membrane protein
MTAERVVTPPTRPPSTDLGGRAVRGAAVTLAGQGVRILVQILSVVVLSRILSPRDYGLLAMVTAVIGVADIFRDLGLSTAAVQARVLTERQRTNLFWINTALGLVLTLAALFLAPALAAMYQQPELVEICRILAVTFLLNGVATQYRADLNRGLRFGWLAAADVVASVMAFGVAVTMAANGAGYWALVGQQIVQYAVMLGLVVAGARWWPRLPSRGADMGGLLRFGWHMVGTQVIGYVANNADSVVIGTRLGPGPLGLYNRAFQLLMTPLTQVRAPTTQVALPVLSAVQDDDQLFAMYVRKGQLALGYTLIAGLGVVLGAAPELVATLLGDQWQAAAPLLGLLALAGALQTLGFVNYWVYLARGLTRALMQYSLIQAAIKITCVAVGSQWGVVGVAAGYALAPALTWPLSFWWLARSTSLPMRPLVASAARILALFATVAVATGLAGAAAEDAPEVVALAAAFGAGALAYLLLCGLVAPLRRDFAAVSSAVRGALRRRRGVAG